MVVVVVVVVMVVVVEEEMVVFGSGSWGLQPFRGPSTVKMSGEVRASTPASWRRETKPRRLESCVVLWCEV